MAVIDCPSPTAGAGDVVAAALPNLKCLRTVTVWFMNPVPVLQTVGLCGKLQEVSVLFPKHCEVGMRCAYRDGCRCVYCCCTPCLLLHSLPAAALLASLMASDLWDNGVCARVCISHTSVCMYICTYMCVCVCVHVCVCAWSSVSNEIKLTSYVFIICCKMYIKPCQYSCSLPAILVL